MNTWVRDLQRDLKSVIGHQVRVAKMDPTYVPPILRLAKRLGIKPLDES